MKLAAIVFLVLLGAGLFMLIHRDRRQKRSAEQAEDLAAMLRVW